MAAFGLDADTQHALDWTILRDGGVSLYKSEIFLNQDVETLAAHGYQILRLSCLRWSNHAQLHIDLEEAFGFPDYYGRNLDALWDCMQDLAITDQGGLLIVLDRFGSFARGADADVARRLVEIFASASRYHALMGRRLITLVQSDDPELRLEGLASINASWNRREWPNKNRGL